MNGGKPVDDLLDGLERALAKGQWEANPQSEVRRLDLLPQTAPLTWDELMFHAPYMQALTRLP